MSQPPIPEPEEVPRPPRAARPAARPPHRWPPPPPPAQPPRPASLLAQPAAPVAAGRPAGRASARPSRAGAHADSPPRPVTWTGASIRLLDQTPLDQSLLPDRLPDVEIHRVDDLVAAIHQRTVRGTAALEIAGAYGVALAIAQAGREGWDGSTFTATVGRLRAAAPAGPALARGVDAAYARTDDGLDAVLAVGHALAEADERARQAIGRHGADWILARLGDRPLRVLTHGDTEALATAGWDATLGVVLELHARRRVERVYVDEARPLLRGSRRTAWELARAGVDYRVQVDAAAAGVIVAGLVDVAVVGADRIAANGDVVNKIGTLGVALACAHAGVPFVVAAAASSIDDQPAGSADPSIGPGTDPGHGRDLEYGTDLAYGTDLEFGTDLELGTDEEVLTVAGRRVAPPGARAHNPAVDVTPAGLVDALITENGARLPSSPFAR